jgi:hypothetical protein
MPMSPLIGSGEVRKGARSWRKCASETSATRAIAGRHASHVVMVRSLS